jgi:hypothetical protein
MTMEKQPSRRLFPASSPAALAVFGALGVAVVAEEDRLGSLYAELVRVHAERALETAVEGEESGKAFEKLYDRHWELREAINPIVATTLAGFRIKAMTAELAFECDLEAECRGPGSFVDLCQSLHCDLLAVDGGRAGPAMSAPLNSRDADGVAAATTPAIDPVFAAIDRARADWDAYVEATCKLSMDELEAFWKVNVSPKVALQEFLNTPPTTMAGLRAALEYVIEVDRDCVPNNGGLIAPTLLKSPLFAGMSAEEISNV